MSASESPLAMTTSLVAAIRSRCVSASALMQSSSPSGCDHPSGSFTALKNSGEATGEDLAKAIRATKYKGLLGDFAYDDTGVGIFATTIGLIKSGKLVKSS